MMRTSRFVVAALVLGSGTVVLASAPASAAAPSVVINELNYNPADDNPLGEWVELLNTTSADIDISGWCFDGITYCHPGGTVISAGGFVLVNATQFSGGLSNSGEEIALADAAGVVVDAVEYDDHDEWPALADGDGHSLQRRDPASDSTDPGNWVSNPPTPWAVNTGAGVGLLPSFSDVEHTVLPAAGENIAVTAELDHATSATLVYRIGVSGPEMAVAMTVGGGTASATIPGQAAGTLVRYRLAATEGGRTGTWPRQGDGSFYTGTTVARPAPSALPLFEFFMDDGTYATMVADLDLSGDDGYPMTFAYKGEVFDNALIRVKGQVSRNFPKKKFKVILPPGHVIDDEEMFPDTVDEFALHSSWSDRSFLRETLASEFMHSADAPARSNRSPSGSSATERSTVSTATSSSPTERGAIATASTTRRSTRSGPTTSSARSTPVMRVVHKRPCGLATTRRHSTTSTTISSVSSSPPSTPCQARASVSGSSPTSTCPRSSTRWRRQW